jgi:monofunctional biosynthetic peptidoglycan transglycosylase
MTMTLFDFREEQARAAWFVENDVVMGGVSSSSMQAGEGVLLFSGTVSLENNGGFASARAEFVPLDLSAYQGVALRVRGDGKRYTLYLRDRPGFIGYQGRFDTQAGAWQTVRLPFSSLRPVRFGSPVQAGDLNTAAIRAIGLIISDKQAGPFALELGAIGVY